MRCDMVHVQDIDHHLKSMFISILKLDEKEKIQQYQYSTMYFNKQNNIGVN
jgi:hypothetical protein